MRCDVVGLNVQLLKGPIRLQCVGQVDGGDVADGAVGRRKVLQRVILSEGVKYFHQNLQEMRDDSRDQTNLILYPYLLGEGDVVQVDDRDARVVASQL